MTRTLRGTAIVEGEAEGAAMVTAENLGAVYGTLVYVEANPYSGQPIVLHTRPPEIEEV